jgi:hypothetical protein
MRSTSDLRVGWRRGKQRSIYNLMDRGGGAMHRERRQQGGGLPLEHEVGNNIAMVRSLCELGWGKRKGRGSDTGTRAKNQEPMRAPGKEGRTVLGARRVRRHTIATRARHTRALPPMTFVGHVATATRQV